MKPDGREGELDKRKCICEVYNNMYRTSACIYVCVGGDKARYTAKNPILFAWSVYTCTGVGWSEAPLKLPSSSPLIDSYVCTVQVLICVCWRGA